MRWTSARLHPTLQCTASQRPSRDSVIDCIDSSIGQVAEDELVVAVVVADDVPPDSLAVLLSPTGSGCTRTRRRRASTRRDDHRVSGIVSASSWPVSTSTIRSVDRSSPPIDTPNATTMPVGGRVVPVERGGRRPRAARRGRSASSQRRAGSVADRTISRNCASPPARSSVNNRSPATRHDGRDRRGRAARRSERAASARAGRASRTRRVRSFWAATHARVSGEVGVLEPPVRVGDLVAVKDVDGVAARGDRVRIEVGQVSLGRSSASCRGSPCSAACAPCASWSSST